MGFRVLYREPQYKRKRVWKSLDALEPSMTIARERELSDSARSISKCKRSESVLTLPHSLSFVLGLPIQNTEVRLLAALYRAS